MSQSPLPNVEVWQDVNKSAFPLKEPKEEEPLFSDDYESSVVQKEIKEEEMSDNERESSHFAMASFFSPARSVDRSRSLPPPREVKEEEIDEEAPILENSPAEGTTDSAKVEKTKRSSRYVDSPVRYTQSMYDSDCDVEPYVKKSKTGSTLKANYKRKSSKGDCYTECPSRKLNVSKKNDTELQCPECEYRTRIVMTWLTHLRIKHDTTPALAGFALLCECGNESLSDSQSRTSNHAHTTVIRKRDGPVKRLGDEKATPQCVLCEAYPKTAHGYAHHLTVHHKSNLAQNGIYLVCSCGIEVRCKNGRVKHLEECDPRQFTLHKLDDEKCDPLQVTLHKVDNEKATPKCVLCEVYPRTASSYAVHLYTHHKSTLMQNRIYLICSCGLEVRSDHSYHRHLEECNPREFTLHKLDDD